MRLRRLLRHPGWIATLALALVVVVVFASTCTAPGAQTLPPPEPTSSTQPEPTTTSIDRSQIVLQPVAGETTTTLTETGDAVLGGVVAGPGGAVPGATVRIERLVGDAVQTWQVQAAQDGRWALEGLPGGRIRVRAFLAPTLTMTEPEIFFLRDGETREVRLQLRPHQGLDVRAAAAPGAPTVGQEVNLAVRVLELVVDSEGVARTRPVVGTTVRLRWSGWTRVDGVPSAGTGADDDGSDEIDGFETTRRSQGDEVTGSDGVALYTFRCDRASSVSATAVLGAGAQEQVFPLEVPSCGPRPTTTTTTTTSTPGRPRSTTSSTPRTEPG